MKKKAILITMCLLSIGLVACGTKDEKESTNKSEVTFEAEKESTNKSEVTSEAEKESTSENEDTSETEQIKETTEVVQQDQALEAIKNYCFIQNPDLESKVDSEEYSISWSVSTNEAGEIVVLYRSYTAAQIRYYIDPFSGETYVTEQVPGIIDEEQRTDENFNIRDYIK